MVQRKRSKFSKLTILAGLVVLLAAPGWVAGEPSPAAVATFNSYVREVESRLARQHGSPAAFLAEANAQTETRLRRGETRVDRLTPAGLTLPGAMLHHWRGTAFAPGAHAADFERAMRDFRSYPRYFAPQVEQARVLAQQGDFVQAAMRVRQKHVIAVVMDTNYDVSFARLDARRGYSISRSTHIAEIASPGSAHERALTPGEEHGFLWRLNTYWSYEERDGGLYIQIESVTLTRSIPAGLGWAVGPFVESVPRESLEFTLRAASNALRRTK